jgi:hypothetical protein
MDFVFRSSLPATYRDALEHLVFFNQGQLHAEGAIIEALETYGSPEIVADAAGLHVIVSRRSDVQCLFALAEEGTRLMLAGMVMFVRTSLEEMLVLHIAVGDRYSRTRRSGLAVVLRLVRAVRAAAHRLRGIERVRMLYREGRQFEIDINRGTHDVPSEAPVPARVAS